MNGACNDTIFWPLPLGPWGGAKRSNIIKFQLQRQFQIFLIQTLCVFSQIRDIKHSREDFHAVVPRCGGIWGYWGWGWLKNLFFPKFNQIWYVSYMNGACNSTFFRPSPLGRGQKVKNTKCIINFQLQSQFQRFLNQTLCVLSEIKYIKHIKSNFIQLPGSSCPWDGLGVAGGGGGVKKLILNMVMWHTKLKRMISRTGYK